MHFEIEDGAIALIAEVSFPEVARLPHELVLEVHVPVLVLVVKFNLLAGRHATHVHNAVVFLHGQVLDCGHREGRQLLEVVHFVHKLFLIPQTLRLVNENQVLFLVVDHLGAVVHVHHLEQDQQLKHVCRVFRTYNSTLYRVL